MGFFEDVDAKVWVLLVLNEIQIFGGQDVKNFQREFRGRWWVGWHILKSTFGTVMGGGRRRGWWKVGPIGRCIEI